jgi:uncharacterized protein YgbK (DUF1537 family)
MKRFDFTYAFISFLVLFSFQTVVCQTTDFTFQGNLKSSSTAANGNFDFEFALFDSVRFDVDKKQRRCR